MMPVATTNQVRKQPVAQSDLAGVSIERVIVKNYRSLRDLDIALRPDLNIIVGDNESGKTTLLEAINLALKCQLNRRPAAYELHPYLFNTECVNAFLSELTGGNCVPPPEILIELFFKDVPAVSDLKGTNNSRMEDSPGVSVRIAPDDNMYPEYQEYIRNRSAVTTIPIEYYSVLWQSFAGEILNSRNVRIHSSLIDPAAISNVYTANKYIVEFTRDYLTKEQQVNLALSYRKLRDLFESDEAVAKINAGLLEKKGTVSDKTLTIGIDATAHSGWESGVLPYLDDVPITMIGKGEQTSIKVKLAIEAEKACDIVLMEEPENHLSHSNLNRLISHVCEKCSGKQLIITTHSSFVLNKMGVDKILMFNGQTGITLNDVSDSTKRYFKKLPGHDTLRMILAKKTVFVEGPSDELIVHKAFEQKYRKSPLQCGVEVISVNALAFKRFLEIAKLLSINAVVITDNDGNADAVATRYSEFAKLPNVKLSYSRDNSLKTLEPHLLAANGRQKLNRIFGTCHTSEEELLAYMSENKADCALKLYDSDELIAIPDYIANAI